MNKWTKALENINIQGPALCEEQISGAGKVWAPLTRGSEVFWTLNKFQGVHTRVSFL